MQGKGKGQRGPAAKAQGEDVEELADSLASAGLGEEGQGAPPDDGVVVFYSINGEDLRGLPDKLVESDRWGTVQNQIAHHDRETTAKVSSNMGLFVGKLGDNDALEDCGIRLSVRATIGASRKALGNGNEWPPGEALVVVKAEERVRVVERVVVEDPPVELAQIQHQQLQHMNDKSVQEYVAIGKHLKGAPEAQNIFRVLQEVGSDKSLPKPFVVIDDSSGTGKSQVVGYVGVDGRFRVVYIVLGQPDNNGSQPFYAAFESTSTAFVTALERDARGKGANTSAVRRLLHSSEKFWSLAVVAKLAGVADVSTALSVAQFKERACPDNMVVFLDEVQGFDEAQLRFARNLFRAADVVVVLLGTHTNAINLVGAAAKISRDSGADPVWARVIVELPATIVGAIPEERRPPWLTQQPHDEGAMHPAQQFMASAVQKARPWFAHVLCKALLQIPFDAQHQEHPARWIMGVFDAAVREVADCKRKAWNDDAEHLLLGQYSLFQKQHPLPLVDVPSQSQSSLLKTHFAHLAFAAGDVRNGAVDFHLFANSVALVGKQELWRPMTVFPPPCDEPALSLMMMQTPSRNAFEFNGKRVSVRFAAIHREALACQKERVSQANVDQPHLDGDDLEAPASVAVVLASHDNGLEGVLARRFLACFASELQPDWRKLSIPDDQWHALGIPDHVVVPYLFPDTPPELLAAAVADVKVGAWNRPPNDKMVDGLDDSGVLTLECKNRNRNLTMDLLLQIVERADVYKGCAFHLVVCSSVAAWKSKSDSLAKVKSNHPSLAVWVAKVDDDHVNFELRIAATKSPSRPMIVFVTAAK